jgi:hypothetical protein
MGVDSLDPAGVYFGTRTGKLFASRDSGRSWQLVQEGLPPVVCVKAAVFHTRRAALRRGLPASAKAKARPARRRRAA